MKDLLNFIADILKIPSILVGLIAMIGLIVQKKPKQVFILSDVPSLNYTKKYINFMLEGLPYLEILDV